MRRKTTPRIESSSSSNAPIPAVSVPAPVHPGLTAEQMNRLAELIADGRSEPPDDLGPADWDQLQAAVRKKLNDRMIRLIARAIAANIHHDGQTK